ncbi:MAG TPA: hypothetical protein VLA55_07360, partial [Ornithinibacter sp.]|nr:hypothetical protein [Ornithinibacter sp.]
MGDALVVGGRAGGKGAAVPRPVPDAVSDVASDAVGVRVEGFRAWLAGVDVGSLSDAERVSLVSALERVKG